MIDQIPKHTRIFNNELVGHRFLVLTIPYDKLD